MSKWIADREPPLSSSLCLWSSRPSPLRALHARFTMRRAVGAISEWGLGRGARRQIQSDRELRCACHRVRRGVRRRLRRLAGHGRPHKGDRQRPATGLEGRQIWLRFATWILLGLEFLRLPPTSCVRPWRRPGTTSQSSPSSPPSAPCSTTFWPRTSWPSTRARKLARKGPQARQNRLESAN